MKAYHANRLWLWIQYFTISIIWGIIIAFVTIKFTAHLEGPFLIPIRILVFILGYSILDIRMREKELEGS